MSSADPARILIDEKSDLIFYLASEPSRGYRRAE
jgi:hypothetical protein